LLAKESYRRKQRQLPGEVASEHLLAADARKPKQQREAAQIADALLRKRRQGRPG
jgi:hypothetical protein